MVHAHEGNMIIRKAFPQVYELRHPTKGKYWLASARSKKWGMNERKTFTNERDALDYAKRIDEQITQNGRQPDLPAEKLQAARSYENLIVKLATYGRTPEEAAEHFLRHLGSEAARQAKPIIRVLADDWKSFKYEDTTLSHKTKIEVRSYARFIKNKWGDLRPDELRKNEMDVLLKKLKVSNNTRRKYLRWIRMFFSWVKDEGHIQQNPTDGIFFKPDDFNGDFYTPEETKKLLRYVVEHEKDLIGYYALLAFAGLRPSEGARVQWQDYTFKTNELYVRKGKTLARHIILEPVAQEWVKLHRENTPQGEPFINLKSLGNREKAIRKAVFDGKWHQDGLRHGFATYFKAKIKSVAEVADYMGNSAGIVKRHYARTIPKEEWEAFWKLTPKVVLATEADTLQKPSSPAP